MKRAAIFMSDFHLGQGDGMEEFHADKEFSELLCRLSQEHAEDEVDLVLLGDVMDLWTTITDPREVNAQAAADVPINFTVTPPVPPPPPAVLTGEEEKVRAVMDAHAVFFDALGRFLVKDPALRRIVYVPGNHDHSVVEPALQARIRNRIITPILSQTWVGSAALSARIEFPLFYEDANLLEVYAEHGNQLTYRGVFKYASFSVFGNECPGFFELKLVWNRLERRYPDFDNVFMGALSPAMWPGLFWWFLNPFRFNWGALMSLRRLRVQYESDPRPAVAAARTLMPSPWRTVWHLFWAGRVGVTRDEFSDQVPGLFDPAGRGEMPLCGHRLDPTRIKTVILGHSHHAKDRDLPGLDGVKYYNLGSWIYRYENGRGLVEQTWVTISREYEGEVVAVDQPAGKITARYQLLGGNTVQEECEVADANFLHGVAVGDRVLLRKGPDGRVTQVLKAPLSRGVIERRMCRRKVELTRNDSSPVTTDGCRLNPVMHEMTDLRVGDVVLYHWNFCGTIKRLLGSLRFFELARVLPEMAFSFINRNGSSSYWSHAAMAYGVPSEREEGGNYSDPLFLEAIPKKGVGVHGPQHYLAHPTDWNLAVLRSTATWLAGNANWDNRRLLRRLAGSALDVPFDNPAVASITLFRASRMLDEQRGKPLLAGFVKGGLFGVGLFTMALVVGGAVWGACAAWVTAKAAWAIVHVQGWIGLWSVAKGRLAGLWDKVIGLLDYLNLAPFLWGPILDLFPRDEWHFRIGVFTLLLILNGILALAAISIGKILLIMYVRLTFAVGAFWGMLMVPVMADLSRSWGERTYAERWAITLVWITIPLLAGFSWIWLDDSTKAGFWVLSAALLVVLFWDAVAQLVAPIIEPYVALVGRVIRRVRDMQFEKEAFICSGLIQYSLLRTALQLIKQAPPGPPPARAVDIADIMVNPQWNPASSSREQRRVLKETLPQHFSQSALFDWVYLLIQGAIRYRPGSAHRAEVNPDPLGNTSSRQLSQKAAWSLKIALLGLWFAGLFGVMGQSWSRLLAAVIVGVLGLAAVVLAHYAWRDLTINPRSLRGRSLTRWGRVLGGMALAAAAAYLPA